MTSQGTAHGRFQRAIHRRHVQAAEMAAREMGGLSLADGALAVRAAREHRPGPLRASCVAMAPKVHRREAPPTHRGRARGFCACGTSARNATRWRRGAQPRRTVNAATPLNGSFLQLGLQAPTAPATVWCSVPRGLLSSIAYSRQALRTEKPPTSRLAPSPSLGCAASSARPFNTSKTWPTGTTTRNITPSIGPDPINTIRRRRIPNRAPRTLTQVGAIHVMAPAEPIGLLSPICLRSTIDANGNVTSLRVHSPGPTCQ